MEPVERIPAEWYGPLNNFWGRQDASDLTTDMLGDIVTEEELALFKDLFNRSEQLSTMDAYERETSPLKLSREEEEWLMNLNDKIDNTTRQNIKKNNPGWPKHR